MKMQMIITDRAMNSLQRIVKRIKQTSLIGGENTREKILNRIRKVGLNPSANSTLMEFRNQEGEYRFAEVWDYRIYYKVLDEKVLILDVLLAKEQ